MKNPPAPTSRPSVEQRLSDLQANMENLLARTEKLEKKYKRIKKLGRESGWYPQGGDSW